MGNFNSRRGQDSFRPLEEGDIFITCKGHSSWPGSGLRSKYDVFVFHMRYQRYHWVVDKRFSDILTLEKKLKKLFPAEMKRLSPHRPVKYTKLFWNHDNSLLSKRGTVMMRYLQLLCKERDIMLCHPMREFLEIGKTSFHPQLGRKGKEGWLQKSSGGYTTSSAGEFIKTWRRRWFVLHDTYFAYYASDTACEPLGFMQIDQKFEVFWRGRNLTVSNKVRKLTLHAPNLRTASNWFDAFNSFYKTSFRRNLHPHLSTFPVRPSSSMRLYVCGKEYFLALCLALLQAKEEIFIASWMVSPTQLLTRPPLPPLRLDQVLKYKAEQGVRVYVLLYKEVEMSGTGNDSLKSKLYLENLSPNVHVIRHPNKLLGSSTAILWSHHEKLVIVDRNLAFAGGIDPCFGRWDDTQHTLCDEEGTLFPGTDYYQPARGLFKPLEQPCGQTTTPGPGIGPDANFDDNSDEDIEAASDEDEGENRNCSSDASDDSVSVSSSCQSFLPEDVSMGLMRTGNHGESIGILTEEEALALRNQGKYEVSPDDLLPQEGHLGPHQLGRMTDFTRPSSRHLLHDPSAPPLPPLNQQAVVVESTSIVGQPSSSGCVVVTSSSVSHVHQQQQQQQHYQHQQVFQQQPMQQQGGNCQQQFAGEQFGQQQTYQQPLQQPQQMVYEKQFHSQTYTLAPDSRRTPLTPSNLFTNSGACSTGGDTGIERVSTRSVYSMSSVSTSFNTPSSPINPVNDESGTVSDKISSWLKGISEAFEDKNTKITNSQLREQYPRMPWHDVHSSVTGLPARDLGAHFVMRWNHHKKSKGSQEHRYLTDMSDVTHFGVCAKCSLENIFETVEHCPRCGHNLGPVKRSLNITKEVDLMIPSTLQADILSDSTSRQTPHPDVSSEEAPPPAAYITFRCLFKAKLGCRIRGDGPVLVTQITDGKVVAEAPSTLLRREGASHKTEALCKQGIFPMIGDVVTSVNGSSVLHLTTEQLQRFLHRSKQKKAVQQQQAASFSAPNRVDPSVDSRESMRSRRDSASSSASQFALTVCFRRYYIDDVEDVVKGDNYFKMMAEGLVSLKDKVEGQVQLRRAPKLVLNDGGTQGSAVDDDGNDDDRAGSEVEVTDVGKGSTADTRNTTTDDSEVNLSEEFDTHAGHDGIEDGMLVNMGHLTSVERERLAFASRVTGLSVLTLCSAGLLVDKNSGCLPRHELGAGPLPGEMIAMSQKELSTRREYKALYDRFLNYNYLSVRRDLVCRVATSMQVNQMMGEFQDLSQADSGHVYRNMLPSPGTLSGTCHVQVLRSVSDWSIGQEAEQSILLGWIAAIEQAQHFIYIENQFFISSLGGSSIKNGIAKALLDRIVLAVQNNQVFKVIVVVPLHPEGDFVHTSGPRGVMNFQYKTICRGKQSLIEQLRRRLQPLGRDPLEYITFNSLRTYGELHGRVVTEQIYVHDKLIIVDDRVMIMGSANVNDRSMLGDRDSEVALRIEDTVHVTSRMNGLPWSAGALPCGFRKRLMGIHLGDSHSDLSDPLSREVYHDLWLHTAKQNTEIYHELDGPASYETCPTIKAFDAAINGRALLHADDPRVEAHLCRIKGHLVFWPQNFLSKETMSFSGSTNAMLPSDLFT